MMTSLVHCHDKLSVFGRMGLLFFWKWHLDEIFMTINGETHYLWRTVDHLGAVLEAFISKRRDCKAALFFLKKIMKWYGKPNLIVTDILRSYRAAMKVIENQKDQEAGR
jgi:putative transposase